MNRADLNDPRTAVRGIRESQRYVNGGRKYLNDPRTAVRGIRESQRYVNGGRKYLNDPQTTVWGIRPTTNIYTPNYWVMYPHC